MGKRSNFKRKPRDFYPTPYKPVEHLVPHLVKGVRYIEPCAGAGDLIDHLDQFGAECVAAFDKKPLDPRVQKGCAFKFDDADIVDSAEAIITNPPWPMPGKKGEPAVSMALHLSSLAPTWFLLAADFKHNVYFVDSGLAARCVKVVSVGRVSWEDNGTPGKDNCAWYLFDARFSGETAFYGRNDPPKSHPLHYLSVWAYQPSQSRMSPGEFQKLYLNEFPPPTQGENREFKT